MTNPIPPNKESPRRGPESDPAQDSLNKKLFERALANDVEGIRDALKAGAEINSVRGRHNDTMTALEFAAGAGSTEACLELLEQGAWPLGSASGYPARENDDPFQPHPITEACGYGYWKTAAAIASWIRENGRCPATVEHSTGRPF